MKADSFNEYILFLEKLDRLCAGVNSYFSENIKCRPGCSDCCMAGLELFPVEAFCISQHITTHQSTPHKTDRCVFLKDSMCTIYEYRPVVCRTQGLPLVYRDEESDSFELSVCEKNFTESDISESIDLNHVIDMDRINTILAAQNINFLNITGRQDLKNRRFTMEEILQGSLPL